MYFIKSKSCLKKQGRVDQGSSVITFDLLVEAFLFLDLSTLLTHLLSLLKRLLTAPNLHTAPLHLNTQPLQVKTGRLLQAHSGGHIFKKYQLVHQVVKGVRIPAV